MRTTNAKNLNALRKSFNSVDSVHGYTIFNIGGNNYRLITAVHYNTQHCDMVKYLMKSRNLLQTDLADVFGGQANVSKFLSGERPLSKNQIIGLKKQFGISADFFLR